MNLQIKCAALTLLGALVCLTTACGEADDQGVNAASSCEQAQAHVQACFPNQPSSPVEGCDEAAAKDVLAQDCAQLASSATATEGKADGYCNPFFWWLCTSSGSSKKAEPAGYTFKLGINVCQSELCVEDLFGENTFGAECGKITLHDADDNIVATDYINAYVPNSGQDKLGGFKGLDLEPGEYTARLWRRDGQLATDVKANPAQIEVTLGEDGEVETSARNFRILTSEADDIRACSDVVGTIATSCDGEALSKEDAEWTWLVRLEGDNAEGSYNSLKRSFFVFDRMSHTYGFARVRPGTYKLTYIELDVWSSYARRSYRNASLEEYEELVERYGTGAELTETVEITAADVAGAKVVEIGHIDLESQVCR